MKINKKKFVYLISPNKISNSFYNNLKLVLKTGKVSFFQLRLKSYSQNKKIIIGKKIKNICKKNKVKFIMTYSYGRALQQSALKYWSKNINDVEGTQKVFDKRAQMNSLASKGEWSKELENK